MQKPLLPRYILCQYIPTSNGKSDKIPLNPATLRAHNPLDPLIHMTYEAAKALAETLGSDYGTGFVFLKKDGYFFIDIDGCVTPEGWNAFSLNAMNYFPTAYMEVSHSEKGLHIIGRYEGEPPVIGRKDSTTGLEVYTDGRFCALAEINQQGNAETVHTDALTRFVESVGLTQTTDTNLPDEWTTEPEPGCNPPEDNLELIELLLNRPLNQREVFGDMVSIRDLWENNVAALAKQWPAEGREYDYSSADAALAYRLHYFTGGNCERVMELMNLSKLKRDKWEHSPNYLPRTVTNARRVKKNYFVYARPPQTCMDDNKGEQASQQKGAFLNIEQQVAYFQNCTYVAETHQILAPEGVLYKPDAFNSVYGGVNFQLDLRNEKVTRKAFEAFTLSQGYAFPKVHGTCFKPLLGFGDIVTEGFLRYVNTYRPINPARTAACVQRFLTHVANLLPNPEDRLILLSYMAALIQYKGVKFTWCVIIQGVEGNGKSFLNEVLAYCIGEQYVHSPKSSELTGRFNGWMENKLLVTVDDIYQSSWDMLEILKPMITNRRQEIERKGVDKVTKEIYCNFILNTNHQDGIRKTRNDRRFAPLFTAQQELEHIERDGMGGNYFPELFNWFYKQGGCAAINEYLCTFEIPDRYNPATLCNRAPVTSSTEEAIQQGIDPLGRLIQEWIEEGHQGFKNGWVSSMAITRMADNRTRYSPKKVPGVMLSLGYIPHPGLPKGRTPGLSKIDTGRPILYVHRNSPKISLAGSMNILTEYEDDQKV